MHVLFPNKSLQYLHSENNRSYFKLGSYIIHKYVKLNSIFMVTRDIYFFKEQNVNISYPRVFETKPIHFTNV